MKYQSKFIKLSNWMPKFKVSLYLSKIIDLKD